MKSACVQSSDPSTKNCGIREPRRIEETNPSPEEPPVNISPSYFFCGSLVTMLMAPPTALGPIRADENPLAT